MAKENNTLLIFDFDNTITNGHMHNTFSRGEKSDFNSGAKDAVTDHNIKDFLKNTGGIKNEEGLKSVLQSALSRGVEVNIASYTGYPNTVKKVAKDYLGLSEEQAKSISVFGGFPADHDTQLPRLDIRAQQSQVGKNLHICKAIVEYKNNHNGQLPKTVMLVDDSTDNIKKIDEFVESISKREGWLKENGLNIEDIKKIKFEGIQAPINKNGKVVGDANYLEKVQGFINANSVQEPIYENSREEESPYATINKSTVSLEKEMETIMSVLIKSGHNSEREAHNAQDLFKKETIEALKKQGYGVSDKDRKEIIVKRSEQIDSQKVQEIIKNASDRIIEGFKASKTAPKENIYQNLQDIQNALKAPEPVHQSASPPVPPKKRKSSDGMIGDGVNKRQDTKDMSSSEAQEKRSRRRGATAYPELEKQVESMFQSAKESLPGKKYAHTQNFSLLREIHAIKKWFEDCAKEIIDAVCNLFKKEVVTKLKGQNYAVSSEQGNDGIIVSSDELIFASKINKDIIVESLKQVMDNKEGIRALGNNYKGGQLEQEISKLLNADLQKENINSNSIGRHYNNGEPTHQTRKETLNADSQKKDINLSRRPLPPLPPESRMEEVKTEGKTKVIGKS